MKLRFDFSVSLVSFIDAMFGLIAFLYVNVQEYRHKRMGTQEEVAMSYLLGAYGFIKGLSLTIPAAQVMVNTRRALVAQRAAYCWLIFSFAQICFTFILLYYYIWPVNAAKGTSDLFLFILRIVHIKFIIICSIFIFLFVGELEPFIPKPLIRPAVRVKKMRKNKTRASAAHHPDPAGNSEEAPEAGEGAESDQE